jgi:general secretion pathway protein A
MYVEHFNLVAEPFNLTPDPAFLYLSPEHREALAAVQYGLVGGRGFITLVGEVGTGKTTLLYSMLGQRSPEIEAAYVSYTKQRFEDLLAAVLKDLNVAVPGTSKRALLDALNAHLLERADGGLSTALVVDEAQNLSDATFEELRLLSNFETYNRKLLQIVLVGQPELQDRLRQPQLRQLRERVAVRAYINPLPHEEMARCIDHRLQQAGGSAEALFEPKALRLIVRRAAGIPRRANILCHNALLFAYGRNLSRVTVGVAREAIAEMDERRPGPLRRPAMRRTDRLGRLRPLVGFATAAGILVAAATHLWPEPTGVHPVAAAPEPPAAAAPEPAAVEVEPPVAFTPPAAPEPLAVPKAPTAPAVLPDERAAVAPRAPLAIEPAPSAATDGEQVFSVRVPQGTTLSRLVREVYGPEVASPAAFAAVVADVLRLNPHVTNANVIIAGDALRLPTRAGTTP